MKRISGIWLALGLSWAVQAANESTNVYYWTDAQGVMHFSDRPVPGKQMQRMQIEVANPPANNPNPVIDTSAQDQKETTPAIAYSLSISSPLPEQTIRDNEGRITVQNQLTPAIPEEDPAELFLYVDENRYPCDAASLSCQVSDIDRGAHQLRTELVSKNGKILASSETVTVYLFRVIAVR
ncbi:MAG: DUF4124 domain-containing protein [Gammaproteobacteria bacterium]|nr:DUF4124 domain-containing protein [Gammaproteobacteria bacterium]